jgi:predicted AAA+ superfamily ATPase
LYYIQQYLKENHHKVIYYDLEFTALLSTLNEGVDAFISDLAGKGYVDGENIFILIDEIQYLDNPSSFLKIIADHYKNIHLIVSGSSTFDIKSKFKDSLAGRTLNFEIFPLSFTEFLTFKESEYVNISNLSPMGLEQINILYHEFIKYGGYPKIVLESSEEKKNLHLLQLIDTYIRKDIRDLADITDITKFNNMLKVLAFQSGQILNVSALSRETNISQPTLHKYLSILEETFIIKRITPFSHSPSVEISKNPKIFFYDSGLQSILWLNNFQDTILGSVFETNIFSQLVKKYGRGCIHFWRTKSGSEIDFIVDENGNSVLPIEVKTSFNQYNPRIMNVFRKKYGIDKSQVVGLTGTKKNKNYLYPWEI